MDRLIAIILWPLRVFLAVVLLAGFPWVISQVVSHPEAIRVLITEIRSQPPGRAIIFTGLTLFALGVAGWLGRAMVAGAIHGYQGARAKRRGLPVPPKPPRSKASEPCLFPAAARARITWAYRGVAVLLIPIAAELFQPGLIGIVPTVALAAVATACAADAAIIRWRIARRAYGDNQYEALETLRFLAAQRNDGGPPGSGRFKRPYPAGDEGRGRATAAVQGARA